MAGRWAKCQKFGGNYGAARSNGTVIECISQASECQQNWNFLVILFKNSFTFVSKYIDGALLWIVKLKKKKKENKLGANL